MGIGRRSFILAAASAFAVPAFADPAPPRTLIEFLQTMKRVAEADALLDPAFYDEANLKSVFAARGVSFGRPLDGYRLYGTVWGFGVLVEPVRMGNTAREGMALEFSLSSPQPGPATGRLLLTFLRPTLPFDEVEAAFGKGWELGAYLAQPDGSKPYAVRAHGNTTIRYRMGGGALARWMEFAFNPKALVESAGVWVR